MLSTQDLLINVTAGDRKGLLSAFNSAGIRKGGFLYIRGETDLVNLRCVRPGLTRLWDDLNLEAARAAGGVRFGLGEFDKAPTAGTWPLAYNGSSTGLTTIDGLVTAAALQTLLNANAAVTGDGGVTVTQTGRSYRVAFTTTGAKHDFTTGDNTLTPLCRVVISRVVTGDGSTHEVVVITVKRRAYAFCDTWTAAPAAAVAVTVAVEGDDSPATDEVQIITLTEGAYGGTYTVTPTLPNVVTSGGMGTTAATITLSATDDADTVLAKMKAHPELVNVDLSANATVTGPIGGPFTVQFVNALKARNIATMAAANINLLVPGTLQGSLPINNDAMNAAFDAAGSDEITLTAELEIEEPGQAPAKPYQDTVKVRKDVLNFETMLPAPNSSYPLPGLVVQFRRAITDFAGLAAIKTAGGGVQCVIVSIAGSPRMWELVAGTDATDTAGGVQRPGDYNGATNAFVWKSIL